MSLAQWKRLKRLKGSQGLGHPTRQLLAMIRFILLQNRQGKTRLSKWYVPFNAVEKFKIESEIHRAVVTRDPRNTNFLEYRSYKIIYRRYAGMFFIFCASWRLYNLWWCLMVFACPFQVSSILVPGRINKRTPQTRFCPRVGHHADGWWWLHSGVERRHFAYALFCNDIHTYVHTLTILCFRKISNLQGCVGIHLQWIAIA